MEVIDVDVAQMFNSDRHVPLWKFIAAEKSRSDSSLKWLMRRAMNATRTVRMNVEFVRALADYDSAIPRFESWRPSQSCNILKTQCI